MLVFCRDSLNTIRKDAFNRYLTPDTVPKGHTSPKVMELEVHC